MSSDSFTKDNLDTYLKELAKEFRKLNGKSMPAEIILVGGAAILTNYGFRNMTTDINAVIHTSSLMKDAINRTGNRFNLPYGWLNTDFMRTSSYSTKIDENSVYYKNISLLSGSLFCLTDLQAYLILLCFVWLHFTDIEGFFLLLFVIYLFIYFVLVHFLF